MKNTQQHAAGAAVDAMLNEAMSAPRPKNETGLGTPEHRAKIRRTQGFHASLPQYRKGSGGGSIVAPVSVICRGKGK